MSDQIVMPADTRPRFTFEVPPKARLYETDPFQLTLTPLRVSDDLEATAIAAVSGYNAATLQLEQLRRSVVAVDGKPVDWSQPGGAEWIERTSPAVRELAIKAYNKIHTPAKDDADAFLASMKVAIGS